MNIKLRFLPDIKIVITIVVAWLFTWFFMGHYILGAVFLLLMALTIAYWLKPQATLFWFGMFLIFQVLITDLTRLRLISSLDEVGIVYMFLLTMFKVIVERRPFTRTPIDVPLLLLVLIGIMSSMVSKAIGTFATLGGMLLFVKGFIIFYIFANVPFNKDHLRFFMKGFLWVGLFICFYGFLGFLSPKIFLLPLGVHELDMRFGLASAQSIMGHPGAFSAIMAILACYSMAGGLIKGDKKFIVLTVLFVIGMILSMRRTSLLGFIIAVSILFIQNPRMGGRIKQYRTQYLIVLAILLLLFSGFIVVMYSDFIASYVVIGNSPRSALFHSGMRIALDYFPLGSGFGTFGSGINQMVYSPLFYKYGLNTIWGLSPEKSDFINDTFWPHVLAETGIVGIICYGLILVGMCRICTRALREAAGKDYKIFAVGAYMTLIVSFVEASKATFYEMSLWTYFYFGAIAIAASFLKEKSVHERSSDQ